MSSKKYNEKDSDLSISYSGAIEYKNGYTYKLELTDDKKITVEFNQVGRKTFCTIVYTGTRGSSSRVYSGCAIRNPRDSASMVVGQRIALKRAIANMITLDKNYDPGMPDSKDWYKQLSKHTLVEDVVKVYDKIRIELFRLEMRRIKYYSEG